MKKRILLFAATIISVGLLTGCGKSGTYNKAMSLYEEGNYEEAINSFEELGDYEDSEEMILACKYAQAETLYDTGDYEAAVAVYETVLDYEDSEEMILACKYAQAETLCDMGDYEAAVAIYETILDYEDSETKLANAKQQIMFATYGDVIDLLGTETWFYNGGSDTLLNVLSFSSDSTNSIIQQILFNGNGANDNGSSEYEYSLDDSMITILSGDEEILSIAYRVEDDELILGDGEYLTVEDVEDGLQGFWTYEYTMFGCAYETNLQIDGNSYEVEDANEGIGLAAGEYYYSGPYSGTYSIGNGMLDFGSGWSTCYGWGFNIIDGEVVPIHFDHICSRGNGLPGQYGYDF